jgi:pSer/pThr/pTyr-binding forkhead associated (FHA) protein
MPTLTLKFKDNVIGDYKLEKGKSLTIGRKESNDVVIENLAVSGHHAKVDSVGDGYLLTDLQSKNGTFVNNQPITSHWLQPDDMVLIGKHTLFFDYAEGERKPAAPAGEGMDQTMVMDTGQYRRMMQKKSAPSEPKKPPAAGPAGLLSMLSGGEGEVEITKKLFKIGKNPGSDLVIGGFMVGQTAVTISKRPNGFSLSYVEGMSKPKVNGKPVKESVMLKEFDVIEIGSVKLQFILKS